jgi:RNA polymerase subunit RPABC4/transcription elongation factor Spt4
VRGLDDFIAHFNFKKAVKIYVILSIILIVICVSVIAFVTRDKIYMAIDYQRVNHTFMKQGISDKLKTELNKLSQDSKDVVNAIILDKDNNVIYKINNSIIGENNRLQMTPYGGNIRYIQDNINKDIIYKIVPETNVILNKDYIAKHQKEISDINEDFPYEDFSSAPSIRLLNYITNRDTKDKIFIIRTVSPIPYAEELLHAVGVVFLLIFMTYWIGLSLWVYKDADKKHINSAIWALLVLITNLVGLIIYTMYKQNSKVCYKCGALQDKENVFCSICGTKINETCKECGNLVFEDENYCSKCGNKL